MPCDCRVIRPDDFADYLRELGLDGDAWERERNRAGVLCSCGEYACDLTGPYCLFTMAVGKSRNISIGPETETQVLADFDAQIASAMQATEQERTAWQKNVGARGAGTSGTTATVAPRRSRPRRAAPSGASAAKGEKPKRKRRTHQQVLDDRETERQGLQRIAARAAEGTYLEGAEEEADAFLASVKHD